MRLLCVLLVLGAVWRSEGATGASRPVISVKNGKVTFTSSSNQDIVFQPGTGGAVWMNGINIQNKTDLVGPKGPKGDPGPAGPKGALGGAGPVGPKGNQGDKGNAGTAGGLGPKGDQGLKGDTGPAGGTGRDGAPGPKGDQGEKGPPGESSSDGGTAQNLLPSYPFWFNSNRTRLPAYGGGVLQIAVSGFSALYHPFFEPAYTCRFNNTDATGTSATSNMAPVTAYKDPVTKDNHYAVNCPVPDWTFPLANVSVSLWFQDRIEIPFLGLKGSNNAEFYISWSRVVYTRGNNSLVIVGEGFNPTYRYIANFTDPTAVARGHSIYSPGILPQSTNIIVFPAPAWNLTGDSRIEVPTFVSLIENNNKTVPYVGNTTGNNFRFFRCEDKVKNGAETDVDCGGLCAKACSLGKACTRPADCGTKLCIASKCASYRSCQDRYNAGQRTNGLYEIDVFADGSFLADIYCDFSTGKGINMAGDGSVPILAAWSCKQIKNYFPGVKTGYRYLRKDNSSSFQSYMTYCDMDTDGGGWTLVIKGTLDKTYMNSLHKTINDSRGFMMSFTRVPYRDLLVKYGDYKSTTRFVWWKNIGTGYTNMQQEIDSRGYQHNTGPRYTRSSSYGSSSMRGVSETVGLSYKKGYSRSYYTAHFFVVGYSGWSSCCDYYSQGCRSVSNCFSVSLGYLYGSSYYSFSDPAWKSWTWTTSCNYAGYYHTSTGNCQSNGAIFIR